MLDWVTLLFAGLAGLAVGSFLNVCICRWPEDESVVSPRSRCPDCGAAIAWRDNIPVVSWIVLRGRCRGCGKRISPLYPVVELATALIWVAAVVRYGLSGQAFVFALFLTLLLGISATDARTYLIPDEFSRGGLVLGLVLAGVPGGVTILQSVTGAAAGFALLYAAAVLGEWLLKRPAVGGGDIKMMAMVGAFLGPLGAVLTIFLGSLLGTIVFLPISLKTRKLVPFGIFLSLGAAVTEIWGDAIIAWYTGNVLT
jgi:leader peptidase (prepilin peptidase)/N-methyltransferase